MQMINIHLPKNPLGLVVNVLSFSPDNVFSIRCIYSVLVLLMVVSKDMYTFLIILFYSRSIVNKHYIFNLSQIDETNW